MEMDNLWIFLLVALAIQLGLLLYTRYIKGKSPKEDATMEKYSIRNRNDAWKLLNDPSIPEQDRAKILEIYTSGFSEQE
jgi:hypothetical protein